MTIQETGNVVGSKITKHNYPVDKGLTAGTTRQTGTPYLEVKEKSFANPKSVKNGKY